MRFLPAEDKTVEAEDGSASIGLGETASVHFDKFDRETRTFPTLYIRYCPSARCWYVQSMRHEVKLSPYQR
jgi:hypothetical protein